MTQANTGDNSLSLLIRLFIIPIIGVTADKIGGIKIANCLVFYLLLSFPCFMESCIILFLATIAIYLLALLTTLNAATTPVINSIIKARN